MRSNNYTTSHIVKLNFDGSNKNLSVYPSTFINNLTLDLQSIVEERIDIEVLDVLGKSVKVESVQIKKGFNSLSINVEEMQHKTLRINIENVNTSELVRAK